MTNRTLINLVLLIALLLLGALAYFKPGIEEKETETSLTSLATADVSRIRIERAVTEDVAFEKRDGTWWMTEPVQAQANELRIEGVLRIAEANSQRSYPASQVDLTKVGLDQPEILLFFDDATPIAFGDTEPLSQARYVRFGETVHLIEDTGYYHVIGAYTTFLDGSLLPDNATIEGLSLPGLKLSRVEGHWSAEPVPPRFSVDQVNALADEWRHAQAVDVRRFNGGKPQGEILVALKDRPEPIRFGILSRAPELVLARVDLGLQYHLPADASDRLMKLPDPPAAEPSEPAKVP